MTTTLVIWKGRIVVFAEDNPSEALRGSNLASAACHGKIQQKSIGLVQAAAEKVKFPPVKRRRLGSYSRYLCPPVIPEDEEVKIVWIMLMIVGVRRCCLSLGGSGWAWLPTFSYLTYSGLFLAPAATQFLRMNGFVQRTVPSLSREGPFPRGSTSRGGTLRKRDREADNPRRRL